MQPRGGRETAAVSADVGVVQNGGCGWLFVWWGKPKPSGLCLVVRPLPQQFASLLGCPCRPGQLEGIGRDELRVLVLDEEESDDRAIGLDHVRFGQIIGLLASLLGFSVNNEVFVMEVVVQSPP